LIIKVCDHAILLIKFSCLFIDMAIKAAYKDPKWSDPFPDPAQSGSFMHRGWPFFIHRHGNLNMSQEIDHCKHNLIHK
jgi:hypothetical protein